ncbi:MAG: N-acetylglucosamine-6-phosphate deacetylase [Micromonosporaceae bacterium]
MTAAAGGRVVVEGRIVTPGGIVDGRVRVEGDRIAGIEPAATGSDSVIVPGFVDLHNHGGGGHTVTDGDPDAVRAAAAFHLRHGTTTLLASLVSAPPGRLRAATARLAALVAEGVLAGVHLEGPYLSPARRGAHHAAHLRPPSIRELDELLEAGAGAVRMVTLAPELPDAMAAVAWLVERGVVVAVGHTDATYAQTREAVDTGARVATHLFNAMRPLHHRDPGPVPALLGRPGVVCELVADGVHLHDAVLALAARAAGPTGAALVTDATAAAGMPDGRYELGGSPVRVEGGVARLVTGDGTPGALAGSTLTMDAALRQAVRAGVPLVDAVAMAATTPAGLLGLAGTVGALAPGWRADLVELDPDLRVRRVMRAGTWVAP